MLAETDTDHAPWTVVESTDRRFAAMKIFTAVIQAMEHKIAEVEAAPGCESPGRRAAR